MKVAHVCKPPSHITELVIRKEDDDEDEPHLALHVHRVDWS